ncbi:GTP-binding protein HflX [Jejuia pallidilutea]|nr:GTP-binding protein HflX [Jejuia pallidilutea]GAL69660.1 GTP-binding protein HflX [Jejuia pallidilutea]
MSKIGNNALFISAINKSNIDDFKKRVYDEVREIHVTRFPYNSFLYPDYNYEER